MEGGVFPIYPILAVLGKFMLPGELYLARGYRTNYHLVNHLVYFCIRLSLYDILEFGHHDSLSPEMVTIDAFPP